MASRVGISIQVHQTFRIASGTEVTPRVTMHARGEAAINEGITTGKEKFLVSS